MSVQAQNCLCVPRRGWRASLRLPGVCRSPDLGISRKVVWSEESGDGDDHHDDSSSRL